jgi:hypothetical protein
MHNICICICMHIKHTHKLINRFFKADWKITLQPKSWDSARGSSVCVTQHEGHFEDSAWESFSRDPAWGSFRRFSQRVDYERYFPSKPAGGIDWQLNRKSTYKRIQPADRIKKTKSNRRVVITCSSLKNMYEAQKWDILEAAYLTWRL